MDSLLIQPADATDTDGALWGYPPSVLFERVYLPSVLPALHPIPKLFPCDDQLEAALSIELDQSYTEIRFGIDVQRARPENWLSQIRPHFGSADSVSPLCDYNT